MAHSVTHHAQGFAHPFFAAHAILAAATGVLSLIGAYVLLTGHKKTRTEFSSADKHPHGGQ
jgi:hypothetical protein